MPVSNRWIFLLVSAALLAPATAADGAMYWGGTIKGAVYGDSSDAPRNEDVLRTFENDVGKDITFINTGQAWAAFDTATMQAAIEAGAIPLVTMGLPEGVTLEEIAAGSQDTEIRAWAQKARDWGYPFLFRPWWEMNGDWYRWGRDPNFIAAWRHFHDLVEEEGASNVTWAWVVNSIWWDPASEPASYYPGDAYVDWVGMDAYNWGRNPIQPDRWASPEQTIGPTLDVLEEIAPGKPVCICENASTEVGGNKESWIHEMLHSYLPHEPEIKAYLWFNWNIEQNGGRWDWPIESSPTAQEAFREGIQSSVYLSSLPPLRPLTKVPLPSRPAAAPSSPPGPVSPPLPNGSWSQAENVSSAGAETGDADVAVAPDGTATAAWIQYDGSNYVVRERRLEPGGLRQGSPTHELSAPGQDAFDPKVVAGRSGVATVVWKRFDGSTNVIQERRVRRDGTPERAVHDLSAGGHFAGQPQVAAAPDGGAIAVWERSSGYRTVVQERRINPSGTPEATHDLSDGEQNAVEPQVVAQPGGGATVVWDRFDGSNQIVQERRIAPDGTPDEETHNISDPGASAVEPQLAVAPDGTVIVVWVGSEEGEQLIQERQIEPSGAPEPATRDVSASGQPAVEPRAAIGRDGTPALAWQQFDGSHWLIQERRIAPAGSLEPSMDVSEPGQDARDPQLVVASDGTATVAWDRNDGSNTVIQARRLGTSSAFGTTVDLSAPGDAGATAIAANGRGTVMLAWRRFDGTNDVVQGATFTPSAEWLSSSPPAQTGIGAPLPAMPSNSFTIGRARLNGAGGATIPVTIPGPGTLYAVGRETRVRIDGPPSRIPAAQPVPVEKAGVLKLRLAATGSARRRLIGGGRARILLRVTYTPAGGTPRTKTRELVLRTTDSAH